MKTSDEKLNQLLKGSVPVPPSNNLSQRIIASAAVNSPARVEIKYSAEEKSSKESVFKQIKRSLIIPKPAYALACSMLVGMLLGWQNPDVAVINFFLNDGLQVTTIEDDLNSLFLAEVNYYE